MTSTASKKAGAALVGFLVGGAAGFVLTETIAIFFHFVLDTTLDAEGNGALLALFAGLVAESRRPRSLLGFVANDTELTWIEALPGRPGAHRR